MIKYNLFFKTHSTSSNPINVEIPTVAFTSLSLPSFLAPFLSKHLVYLIQVPKRVHTLIWFKWFPSLFKSVVLLPPFSCVLLLLLKKASCFVDFPILDFADQISMIHLCSSIPCIPCKLMVRSRAALSNRNIQALKEI